MTASAPSFDRRPRVWPALALFFIAWIITLLWFGRAAPNSFVPLIAATVLPFGLAAFALVVSAFTRGWHTSVPIPFLLPGLLIFFKQNDALITLLGNIPLNDILGAAVAMMLISRLSRDQLKSTLAEASLIFLALGGLLLSFVVSSIYAVDIDRSRSETLTLAKDIVFACLVGFSIRNLRDLRAFTAWLVFSVSFCAAIIIYDTMTDALLFPREILQTWQGDLRSSGASLESVPFVATMLIIGLFAAGNLAVRQSRARWVFATLAILGIAAVIVSITRSATVTLAITGVIFLWRIRREPFFPLAAYVCSVIALIAVLTVPQSVVSKFTALTDPYEDRTVARRISYIQIGADLFQSSPLLGVGVGSFPKHYTSDDYRFERPLRSEPRTLHNLYFQYPVEVGIFGGVFFYAHLLAIGMAFWRGSQARNPILRIHSEAYLLGFFAVCIQMFFLASKSFLGLWILTGVAIAVTRLNAVERRLPILNRPRSVEGPAAAE